MLKNLTTFYKLKLYNSGASSNYVRFSVSSYIAPSFHHGKFYLIEVTTPRMNDNEDEANRWNFLNKLFYQISVETHVFIH